MTKIERPRTPAKIKEAFFKRYKEHLDCAQAPDRHMATELANALTVHSDIALNGWGDELNVWMRGQA